MGGGGQPFEIYDRIYYDPQTLQPIDIKEQKSTNLKAKMKSDQQKSQTTMNKIDEMFIDDMFLSPNTQNAQNNSAENSSAVTKKVVCQKRSRWR